MENMIDVEAIKGLIDQIPNIKRLFSTKKYPMISYYDRKAEKRKESGPEFQTIREQPEFLRWREQLYFELNKIETPYTAEIKRLLTHFNGFNDEDNFKRLESKLYVLRDHLEEYREDCCDEQTDDDMRGSEEEICSKILRAVCKLQGNSHYDKDSTEDTMNDYIRDILGESYIVRDQTRQGESENGDRAGEVDMQICFEDLPVAMIEAIKVYSLERNRLAAHMNKVLTKYDPNGCPYVFLVIYTTIKRFDVGYKNILTYFEGYEYPYPRETNLQEVDTGYGEIKHAQITLNRNDKKTKVHIWIVHIV